MYNGMLTVPKHSSSNLKTPLNFTHQITKHRRVNIFEAAGIKTLDFVRCSECNTATEVPGANLDRVSTTVALA